MAEPLPRPTPAAEPSAEEFLSQLPSGTPLTPFLEAFAEEEPEERATRPGRPIEGEEDDPTIELSEDGKEALGRELAEILRRHDQAMNWRWEREKEILDNYDMEAADTTAGEGGESSRVPSEETCKLVDQSAAKLVGNTMSVDPIMAVTPILGAGEEAAENAKATERGLNNYAMHTVDFDNLLPVYLTETVKLGTAVLHVAWRKDSREYSWYSETADGRVGDLRTEERRLDRVKTRLVENHLVVRWPPTGVDWQEAEVVGHREPYTKDRFEAQLVKLGLNKEERDALTLRSEREDEKRAQRLRNQGVEVQGADSERWWLTELWCSFPLVTGEGKKSKTHQRWRCIYHEASRKVLKVWRNTRRRQTHPYYPIRWKLKGDFAWGDGVGHEALWGDSVDETLRNLELDNTLASAFYINEVVSGSLADRLFDRLEPGQKVPVDKIGEEIKSTKIGGEATNIPALRQDNSNRLYELTGLPPVTRGMGDPTMKSGAGTGSTLALIEQAQGKFDWTTQRVRLDLSALYTEILELVADNAADEVLVKHMEPGDTRVWRMMRWTPPRGSIVDEFHIYAHAPSPSTSREARKMTYLAIYQFAERYVGWLLQAVVPYLQQTQPGVVPRYLAEIATFLTTVARQVVEHHDMPGVKELVPAVPTPTPAEQQVGQLMQQLQQMAAQLQGGQPPAAPPGGEPS